MKTTYALPYRIRRRGWIDAGHAPATRITRAGRYYTRTAYPDGATCIESAPSAGYYERYLLGDNTGARIREYWRNG